MAKSIVYIDVIVDDKGTTQRLAVDASKASTALGMTATNVATVDRNLKGAAATSSNATKNFSKMQQGISTGLVPLYARIAAQVFALSAAYRVLVQSADYRIMIQGQQAMTSITGVGFQSMTKSIQAATDAQLSYTEAAQSAAIGSSFGLTTDEMTKFAKGATTISKILGRDLTDTFSRLTRGVTKAEPELLDELGIILRLKDASQAYAEARNIDPNSLTTWQKQRAVFEEVNRQVEKMNASMKDTEPASNAIRQLGTKFISAFNSIEPILAKVGETFANLLINNMTLAYIALIAFTKSMATQLFPALTGVIARKQEELAVAKELIATEKQKQIVALESVAYAQEGNILVKTAMAEQMALYAEFGVEVPLIFKKAATQSGAAWTRTMEKMSVEVEAALINMEKSGLNYVTSQTNAFHMMSRKIVEDWEAVTKIKEDLDIQYGSHYKLMLDKMVIDTKLAGKEAALAINQTSAASVGLMARLAPKIASAFNFAIWVSIAYSLFVIIKDIYTEMTATDADKAMAKQIKSWEEFRESLKETNKDLKIAADSMEEFYNKSNREQTKFKAGVASTFRGEETGAKLAELKILQASLESMPEKMHQAEDAYERAQSKTSDARRAYYNAQALYKPNVVELYKEWKDADKQADALEMSLDDLKTQWKELPPQIRENKKAIIDTMNYFISTDAVMKNFFANLDLGALSLEDLTKQFNMLRDVQERHLRSEEEAKAITTATKRYDDYTNSLINTTGVYEGYIALVEQADAATKYLADKQANQDHNVSLVEEQKAVDLYNEQLKNYEKGIIDKVRLNELTKISIDRQQKLNALMGDGYEVSMQNLKLNSEASRNEIVGLEGEIAVLEQATANTKEKVKGGSSTSEERFVYAGQLQRLAVLKAQKRAIEELIPIQEKLGAIDAKFKRKQDNLEVDRQSLAYERQKLSLLHTEGEIAYANAMLAGSENALTIRAIDLEKEKINERITSGKLTEKAIQDEKETLEHLEAQQGYLEAQLEIEKAIAAVAAQHTDYAMAEEYTNQRYDMLGKIAELEKSSLGEKLKNKIEEEKLSTIVLINMAEEKRLSETLAAVQAGTLELSADQVTETESALRTSRLRVAEESLNLEILKKQNSELFQMQTNARAALGGALTEGIAGAIKGEEDDIKTIINNIAQAVFESMADSVAKMLSDQIMGALFETPAEAMRSAIEESADYANMLWEKTFANGATQIAEAIKGNAPELTKKDPLVSPEGAAGKTFSEATTAWWSDVKLIFGTNAPWLEKLKVLFSPGADWIHGLMSAFTGIFGGGPAGVKPISKWLSTVMDFGGPVLGGVLGHYASNKTPASNVPTTSYDYGGGSTYPKRLPEAALGGITAGPTLAGEGRYNEAIVPLPNGRAIPVVMNGGGTNNVSVSVNVAGGEGQKTVANSNSAGQLGRAISAAVQAELVKQKRPGGILSPYGAMS